MTRWRSASGATIALGLILVCLSFSISSPAAAWAGQLQSAHDLLHRGMKAFERGALEEAVSSWSDAARLFQQHGARAEQISALILVGQGYSALGKNREATSIFEAALDLAQQSADTHRTMTALAGLGEAYLAIGRLSEAAKVLKDGLGLAESLGDLALLAALLNVQGNLFVAQEKYGDAIDAYSRTIDLAATADPSLAARARANIALPLRKNGAAAKANEHLDAALKYLLGEAIAPSHDVTLVLIRIGLAYRALRPSSTVPDDVLGQAVQAFDAAAAMGQRIGDREMASYAWGYHGALLEDVGRNAEALRLTRKAVFAAQQIDAPESLYRWQWQHGRLRRKSGSIDEAIGAYRSAVATLQSIRPGLTPGGPGPHVSFREGPARVYFEFADLLLHRTASLQNSEQVQADLLEARDAVELFKVAELRDYFRDDCVDLALSRVRKVEVVSPTAAIVYPILLPDRLELLVSLGPRLKLVTVPIGVERITAEVRRFRRALEEQQLGYLGPATQLYEWLVKPLEHDLAALNIDTLVFVPDGPLRTIPMAALHDGKQFLIARYAVAITPGLNLTDPRPLDREHAKVLAVGLTQGVQGFPALPYVAKELDALRSLFGSRVLSDQAFLTSHLGQELKDQRFTIVHIASHGEFQAESNESFLVTFDGKISMDQLGQLVGLLRFRDEPLELLTLSACDTAAGDDRAALGLAGVAVKAGARSAVGTLWRVSDQAAAELISEFYRQLKRPGVSRAAALQQAQLTTLSNPRYAHPFFWAPFLLINNWL